MKIFIDVDNTIIEHYGFYSYETESRVHKSIGKFPEDNIESIKYMYKTSVCHDPDTIKELFKYEDVHILTKYPDLVYEVEKQKRIARLFNMSVEELTESTNKKGEPKYIKVLQNDSKVQVVKDVLNLENIDGCILVDDYSQNIIEWENEGGIGIKYFNEYNSPKHPINGISISSFKFFKPYLSKNNIENIIIVGSNQYKVKLIEENFLSDKEHVTKINFMKVILKNLTNKLGILKFDENHKYSYMQFIINYYEFMDNIDPKYWSYELNQYINVDNVSLISSNFEPNFNNIFQNTGLLKRELISIHILSSDIPKPKNTYDIYLTINEKRMVNNMESAFLRITNILKSILLNEV
jgi:hypothetical protein